MAQCGRIMVGSGSGNIFSRQEISGVAGVSRNARRAPEPHEKDERKTLHGVVSAWTRGRPRWCGSLPRFPRWVGEVAMSTPKQRAGGGSVVPGPWKIFVTDSSLRPFSSPSFWVRSGWRAWHNDAISQGNRELLDEWSASILRASAF